MTLVNLLQLALWAGALMVIARRGFVLWWRASLSFPVFRAALEPALANGHLGLAERVCAACMPAWAARLAGVAIEARAQGDDASAAVSELRERLEYEAAAGLYALHGLGRLAIPLALIGIILELSEAFSGGSGLVALQRGLAASLALERALLTFSIGFATSLLCFTAVRLIRSKAQALRGQLSELVRILLPSTEKRLPLDPKRADV